MFEDVRNCGAGKFVSRGKWIHPDRVIDSFEIIFVTKGEVYINENGTDYSLKRDEMLILEPRLRHRGFKESENTEFFWLHWYGGPEIEGNLKHRRMENSYNILLFFRQLLSIRVTEKNSEAMDYLTRLILIDLYSNSNRPNLSAAAERAAAWIDANSYSEISASQVAKRFGYNADYLNRLFRTSFSKSLKQYINEKRMEHIKELLLSNDLPLKDVAIHAGFTEYKYFLKFFTYHEKITPTEFRREYAKMHLNSR